MLSMTTTKIIMIHVNSITVYLRASLTPQKSITYAARLRKQHTDISKQTQQNNTPWKTQQIEANLGAAAAGNDDGAESFLRS